LLNRFHVISKRVEALSDLLKPTIHCVESFIDSIPDLIELLVGQAHWQTIERETFCH